jgi:redox-sensitive bicupin YhaK (pirin superfamily)
MPDVNESQPSLSLRSAQARGQTELGWLHSRHTFSFGEYYDAGQRGFRSLRVINDDVVEPGQGFGTHPHANAEIFSYVIEGELAHKDSMGNGSTIRQGELQYMSAGSGVTHSEFNPSDENKVHFLQFWLKPKSPGGEPRYAEKQLRDPGGSSGLQLLFSGHAQEGVTQIRQDADIYFGKSKNGLTESVSIPADKGVWIHVIKGTLKVMDEVLQAGDGAAIENTDTLNLTVGEDSEFLLFVLV